MAAAAGRGRERDDRISKLGDGVLGHILSFLPSSKESARAAALSTRWRDVYAGVHTVCLEQPDRRPRHSPILDWDNRSRLDDSDNDHARFGAAVTAALLARGCRLGSGSDATPLRALREADIPAVDEGVDADIACTNGDVDDHDYVVSTDGETDPHETTMRRRVPWPPMYTVPRALFSCAALRTLRIGPCRLSPPAAISLPCLETLLLAGVYDEGGEVQRLVSACPRLADLTLKACHRVTALRTTRLRRLALLCCPNLATVAVDACELRAFEYRGAVPPDASLLTTTIGTGGGGSWQLASIASCKINIYREEDVSEAELTKLREFLGLFAAATECLHLRSFRVGSGIDRAAFANLLEFSTLLRLELRGCLPRDDTPYVVVAAMARILQRAPNLEAITVIFDMGPHANLLSRLDHCHGRADELGEFFDDTHLLGYNRHDVLYAPSAAMATTPVPCRVREINLVHYQGGWAQRSLAKFLLCNAPVIQELYCGLARGPLWIQTELMREMQGWVMNDMASTQFH
ncbi:hypothetical protein BRADI_4g11820v3 [Brachypodium distachyon]|uniref:F-box/LRR-repeat protein 15/At3g58940/PEG3-like LRR domain-containing protein n=1 Tax=Brachypodium distachyon TaxID=15368 RepID=A0A2K2CM70_BRADI|nr:hypothetical protein BRADI_4g11820v3 [Brachypodium distachyon]